MPRSERAESVNAQLASLRSDISDLAHKIDVNKTKTGAAFGGGVFTLLLAAGAGYDLLEGKSAAWSMVGVTHQTLMLIAVAFAFVGLVLLTTGFLRTKNRDASLDIKLEEMELKYAELLDTKEQTDRQ